MSAPGVMTANDWKKQGKAALVWFAPVALIWINQALGAVQQPHHVFGLEDLVPSQVTVGAIVAWFLSQLQGVFLRFSSKS